MHPSLRRVLGAAQIAAVLAAGVILLHGRIQTRAEIWAATRFVTATTPSTGARRLAARTLMSPPFVQISHDVRLTWRFLNAAHNVIDLEQVRDARRVGARARAAPRRRPPPPFLARSCTTQRTPWARPET
jgi:hypothetical protein